jgi:murein L,D-transpeptidase YafK
VTTKFPVRKTVVAVTAVLVALTAAWAINHYAGPESETSQANRRRLHNRALHAASAPLTGTPDLARFTERLQAADLRIGSPVFFRVFKREFELEVWLRHGDSYRLFATYPVCNWSGALGPKLREGDAQAPEGFYTVDARALNPQSRWHRSFNLGYPNAFDRAHGRTGSLLMVHGGCSSVGCFAMTDPVIDEIWRLVTASLAGGQKRFHVHVFPFRMTSEAMAASTGHRSAAFWQTLKAGYDAFEIGHQVPEITVCNRRYSVAAATGRSAASDAALVQSCQP